MIEYSEADSEANSDYSDWEYENHAVKEWKEEKSDINDSIITSNYSIEIITISINRNEDEFPKEEDYREKLINVAMKNCCWGQKAAKNMKKITIDKKNVIECTREFFVEKRSLEWSFVAFRGQSVGVNVKSMIIVSAF